MIADAAFSVCILVEVVILQMLWAERLHRPPDSTVLLICSVLLH